MIKSKHFRKDVMMARGIVLGILVLLVLIIALVVSALSDKEPRPNENPSESGIDVPTETESETETDSETESETETETETETESETETETETKRYVKVNCKTTLNLRVEPNTNCAVIVALPNGTVVELLEELDDWFKVSYKNKVGYLSKDWAKIVTQ